MADSPPPSWTSPQNRQYTTGEHCITSCPAGTEAATWTPADKPTLTGKYSAIKGYCKPCAAGTYAAAGSNSCTPCPTNSYCPAGSGAFTHCPAHSVTSGTTAATSLSDCVCDKGYTKGDSPGACTPCPVGSYNDKVAGTCEKCTSNLPKGVSTGAPRAGASSGQTTWEGACTATKCTSGHEPSKNGDSCVPCPTGTYSLDGGACTDASCPAGKYVSSTTTVKAPTCLSCPANTYNPSSTQKGITACIACPSGSTTTAGSTNVSDCKCQTGKYMSGTGLAAKCLDCADISWGGLTLSDIKTMNATQCLHNVNDWSSGKDLWLVGQAKTGDGDFGGILPWGTLIADEYLYREARCRGGGSCLGPGDYRWFGDFPKTPTHPYTPYGDTASSPATQQRVGGAEPRMQRIQFVGRADADGTAGAGAGAWGLNYGGLNGGAVPDTLFGGDVNVQWPALENGAWSMTQSASRPSYRAYQSAIIGSRLNDTQWTTNEEDKGNRAFIAGKSSMGTDATLYSCPWTATGFLRDGQICPANSTVMGTPLPGLMPVATAATCGADQLTEGCDKLTDVTWAPGATPQFALVDPCKYKGMCINSWKGGGNIRVPGAPTGVSAPDSYGYYPWECQLTGPNLKKSAEDEPRGLITSTSASKSGGWQAPSSSMIAAASIDGGSRYRFPWFQATNISCPPSQPWYRYPTGTTTAHTSDIVKKPAAAPAPPPAPPPAPAPAPPPLPGPNCLTDPSYPTCPGAGEGEGYNPYDPLVAKIPVF